MVPDLHLRGEHDHSPPHPPHAGIRCGRSLNCMASSGYRWGIGTNNPPLPALQGHTFCCSSFCLGRPILTRMWVREEQKQGKAIPRFGRGMTFQTTRGGQPSQERKSNSDVTLPCVPLDPWKLPPRLCSLVRFRARFPNPCPGRSRPRQLQPCRSLVLLVLQVT